MLSQKVESKEWVNVQKTCDDWGDRLQKRQPRSQKVTEMMSYCEDIATKLNIGKILEKLEKMADGSIKSSDLAQMKKYKHEIESPSPGDNAEPNDVFYQYIKHHNVLIQNVIDWKMK